MDFKRSRLTVIIEPSRFDIFILITRSENLHMLASQVYNMSISSLSYWLVMFGNTLFGAFRSVLMLAWPWVFSVCILNANKRSD